MKIGITGHQNIGSPEVISWVRNRLLQLVSENSCTYGFTSLAVGADQLFAEILLDRSIPYAAIIPAKDYTVTFSNPVDLNRYHSLLKAANKQYYLDFRQSSEEAFFEAGKDIVRRADMMVAVWNGKPAKGLGGTADVVRYACEAGKTVMHINNWDQTVRLLEESRPIIT